MADTSKAKATAAGIAAVALVATASIAGGGGDSTAYPDAVLDLQAAVVELTDAARGRGMALPDSPGVNDVTAGLDGMAPAKGVTTSAYVSRGGGSVAAGDPVRLAYEAGSASYTKTVGTLTDGALLAAASDSENRVNLPHTNHTTAAVYVSGGQTYLAAVYNTYTSYTVTLSTAAATSADVTVDPNGNILAVYSAGGACHAALAKWNTNGGFLSIQGTLTWAGEGGENLHLCLCGWHFDLAAVVYTDAAGRAALAELEVDADAGTIAQRGEKTLLTAEACPALAGMVYALDADTAGWDICTSADGYFNGGYIEDRTNWRGYDEGLYTLLLTAPNTEGEQVLIWAEGTDDAPAQVKGYADAAFLGGGTGGAIENVPQGGDMATALLARPILRDGKTSVGIALYWSRQSDSAPAAVCRGVIPGSAGAGEVRDIRVCGGFLAEDAVSAVSWVADGALYAATVDIPADMDVTLGPAVMVADGVETGYLVPGKAMGEVDAVYLDSGGALKVTRHALQYAASTVDADGADGVALSGGEAGQTVKVYQYEARG